MTETPTPADQSAINAVLQALQSLYTDPDNTAKANANTWLQEFQKTTEAWQTANSLLLSHDLPVEPRLFASQTFRTKITFDLEQVPVDSRPQLRDTLLHALSLYTSGPRVIQTQISLALSGLALQMTEEHWPAVIPGMIQKFGSDPATVATLLEFLTVLPEEVTTNHRIPIDIDSYNNRVQSLLSEHAGEVLKALAVYIQAPGITQQIQSSIFQCLRSWLKSGEISARQMVETPLFQFSFDALASETLFDVAVDVLCDLIHETQEVEDNMDVIQLIVPRVIALKEALAEAGDDEDKVRGLCRIFVQAGESYHRLVLRHKDEFFPIVQAIAECASYHDLDIVQITFRFWYLLASGLAKSRDDPSIQPFLEIYERLLAIIIRHLRFPDDPDALTGQEKDDFRSFRHYMGDTLKDCCHVLGSRECLSRSLQMIQSTLAEATAPGATLKWQDVEAPLFSMRAMGAEADPRDDEVIPRIIDIIPKLPDHPKLKYAGLLVVSRYTEWIDMHPDRIPEQLSYISAGLDHPSTEVSAAAAQAMNFMCQDCKRHLVPFLPQLYEFFRSVGDKLGPDDLMAVSEAIAHILAGMPPREAAEPLLKFTQPLLESLNLLAATAHPEKDELRRGSDRMEQLEKFLQIVGGGGSGFHEHLLPEPCSRTAVEAYSVIDKLIANHGHVFFISERASALIRRGLSFFGPLAIPALPPLLDRLSEAFERTGFPGNVWIVGKCIDGYGRMADDALRSSLSNAFERISAKVMAMLENSSRPADLSDVIDDYVHTCTATAGNTPSLLYLSPLFPHSFNTALTALTLLDQQIIQASLDFVREVVCSDSLSMHHPISSSASSRQREATTTTTTTTTPNSAPTIQELQAHCNAISQTLEQQGPQLCSNLIKGLLLHHFDPDHLTNVVIILKAMASHFGQLVTNSCLGVVRDEIPPTVVGEREKQRFLERFPQVVAKRDLDGVKAEIVALFNASRKSRERSERVGFGN
ncbi:ARM repeat-containing protein [Violaceomyces palustris]|uniref:ARM repeat-containing protein n=1 Tax=Violaceomyces palustris TaxID=1673888 RepID=A0ACD0P7A9_9BASI|nr:ARM repeat-containing protein [Violaceomyces palustris]